MLLHEPTPGVGDRQEDPSIFSPCSPSSSFFFFSAEEGEVVEEDRVEQGLGVVDCSDAMIFSLPCFNRREHSTPRFTIPSQLERREASTKARVTPEESSLDIRL